MAEQEYAIVVHPPSEDNGPEYCAEIPALPGCCAWGETEALAREYLEDVKRAWLEVA